MKQKYQTSSLSPVKSMGLPYRFFLFLTVLFSWTLNAQQSFTFTPCSATGTNGPTQTQVNNAYVSTSLNGNVSVSGLGIQVWTVPANGLYRIETYGAEGGTAAGINPGATGGKGAVMMGEFNLTAGQTLSIVVGQKGGGSNYGGGGGGGSYVVATGNVPLCIAGGGGGATGAVGANFADGYPGLTTTGGGNSNISGGGYGSPALGSGGGTASNGGTNGYGGGSGVGAGGGGFYGDGANGGTITSPTYNGSGKGFVNGSAGGWGSPILNSGGFGGGGGTWASAGYGGGGGGYSGGGGGSLSGTTGNGGGGGSFNSGTNQNNTAGINTGDGKVVFTSLCNINVAATNTLICAGSSVTLTTNAVSNYSWSTGNTTSTLIVVSPTSNATYSVSGTGSFPVGCTSTLAISITVNNTPTITINSSTTSACLGQTVSLTASGANSYVWTGATPTITNGITFTPGATATYTVNGTNACSTSSAAVTVTISALPILVSATSTLVCASTAATLMAGGATTYTWMPGTSTQTNYITNPAANTVYTVTGKTGNCLGTNTIAITTKPNPTITIAASNATICNGGSAVLTASGAITYSWSPLGSSNPMITVSPTLATLYTVVGTNAVNCNASASQVILVNAKPVMNVSATDAVVCPGGSSTLTATGASTYLWDGTTTGATLVVHPVVTTTYAVVGTGTNTCSNATMITVGVFDPSLTVSSSTAVCRGINVNLSASGMDTYQWSTGSGFSSINVTPTITTTYSVNTTSTQGAVTCSVSGAVTVSVNPNPTVTAVSNATIICKGTTAVITASGAVTYTWSGSTPEVAAAITVTPSADQTYTVAGQDANGCKGSGTTLLRVAGCVGIANNVLNGSNVSVYPNPSNGDFTITSDQAIDLKITNELGQLVRTVSLSRNNTKVSISDLESGIYFITGKNDNGDVKQKIIVSK